MISLSASATTPVSSAISACGTLKVEAGTKGCRMRPSSVDDQLVVAHTQHGEAPSRAGLAEASAPCPISVRNRGSARRGAGRARAPAKAVTKLRRSILLMTRRKGKGCGVTVVGELFVHVRSRCPSPRTRPARGWGEAQAYVTNTFQDRCRRFHFGQPMFAALHRQRVAVPTAPSASPHRHGRLFRPHPAEIAPCTSAKLEQCRIGECHHRMCRAEPPHNCLDRLTRRGYRLQVAAPQRPRPNYDESGAEFIGAQAPLPDPTPPPGLGSDSSCPSGDRRKKIGAEIFDDLLANRLRRIGNAIDDGISNT